MRIERTPVPHFVPRAAPIFDQRLLSVVIIAAVLCQAVIADRVEGNDDALASQGVRKGCDPRPGVAIERPAPARPEHLGAFGGPYPT